MTDSLLAMKGFANKLIPISRFNRGEAAKIFDELNQSGVKVVLKNNEPVGVIIQPERYDELMEMLEDFLLYMEVQKRLKSASPENRISEAEMLAKFGLTEADLEGFEDVELD